MSSVVSFLGGFMVNPALFLLGVAAIASPIIIHLLNKRKFKRVDWAAMDFLLEADKKNRRRVRLENLILLLLRCLACLLIGLLLARFFWPRDRLASLLGAEEFDRVILLDNSLSMSVKKGSDSSLQNAKAALAEFVMGLSANGSSDDLTLYVTSDPHNPIVNGKDIDNATAALIVADIQEKVQLSDRPANLANALLELEKTLDGKTGSKLNQVVYVISDMRKTDWPVGEESTDEEGVPATLKRIAAATSGCFLVDIGREDDVGNVFVEEVRCKEKALVAGVPSDFEVVVRNTGKREAKDVKVQFVARFQDGGQIPPLEEVIESLAPDATQTVPFKFAFSREELAASESGTEPARILASVVPASEDVDELVDDNERFFAARVAPGIRTLIVDGDRLPERRDSEAYFLARALSPPGDQLSGMAVDVVGETEFENLRLDDYQIIYLCNLYRIPEPGGAISVASAEEPASDEEEEAADGTASSAPVVQNANPEDLSRREQLERWVANGGGLVIAMGERVDEDVFNEEMYRDGKGLSPVKLAAIMGEVDETKWVKFNMEQAHPVMSLFADTDSPFIELVKIFRWWDSTIAEEDLQKGRVNVIARYTEGGGPAVVERQFGSGRVFAFTTALDRDWSDWPQDHSFVPTMLELNKYMARQTSDDANVRVGDALEQDLDLSKYELQFQVAKPDKSTMETQAVPPEGNSSDQVFYQAKFDEVKDRGFYQLVFNRRDAAGAVPMLFAANIDSREGDLMRADVQQLQRKMGDAKVSFITADDLLKINVDDARIHLWPLALALLVGVLALEQFLGWRFGSKR